MRAHLVAYFELRRFIYIENQYFLGSAQYWLEHNDAFTRNMIPYALVRRICKAIHNKEKFVVYVLTPLFPEGVPSSLAVQEILQWQFQTMRFMYSRIGEKLKEVGDSTSHPKDYLQVYFPGNRQTELGIPTLPNKPTPELASALQRRRHVIYVHSKMMIVDDESIILGSANINDRSMAGCRDTEIAANCWQPAYAAVKESSGKVTLPKGEVSRFRMHLWEEHFGGILPEFEDPASPECIEITQEMAEANWQIFADDKKDENLPHGHMCVYPHTCAKDGSLSANADYPNVPGTSAPLCGTRTMLPMALTT